MTKALYRITGIKYCPGGQEAISKLASGELVALVREPKNKVDPNAIGVFCVSIQSGQQLGYIPAVDAFKLSQFIDRVGQPSGHDSPMGFWITAKFVAANGPHVEVEE